MGYHNSLMCQQALAGIEAIDFFLADNLTEHFSVSDNELLFHILLALQFHQRNGHSCLPLHAIAGQLCWQDEAQGAAGYQFPAIESLREVLNRLPLDPEQQQPLVYEDDLLYLRRYWQFEVELADALRSKLKSSKLKSSTHGAETSAALQQFNHDLFANSKGPMEGPDWQQVAVSNALIRPFTIISGGPGTGKTYTVARVLAALQKSRSLSGQSPLSILMAAPTGKAAQRLNESIAGAKQQMLEQGIAKDDVDSIPEQASTLHRLLGFRPNSLKLKHDAEHPLDCELLLIDEASMVDLPMMTRVVRALPETASLILLGDVEQLPSVDTGCVLADLACRAHPGYSHASARHISVTAHQDVPVCADGRFDHLTLLTKSHRFDGGGDIGQIARQVIQGEADKSWSLLLQNQVSSHGAAYEPLDQVDQLTFIEDDQLDDWLPKACRHYFGQIQCASSLKEAFTALGRFRVLVATRVGERGIVQLNQRIEAILSAGWSNVRSGQHYRGRPIMVAENNYANQLFNGDVGLIWPDPEQGGKLQAWFESGRATFRKVNIARLPIVETVYAMTIHKTQGSEFAHVAMILPESPHDMLSPELLYTGLTRAKTHLYVIAKSAVWKTALKNRIQRFSGLAKRVFEKVK